MSVDTVDRQAIVDTLSDYTIGIDLRDWPRLERALANELLVDFTSWKGGRDLSLFPKPVVRRGKDWTEGVRRSMAPLKATHHLLGQISIEPDPAGAPDVRRVIAYVQATHYLPNEFGDSEFVVGGYYDNRVTRVDGRWVITELRLIVLWSRGNRFVFNLAFDLGKDA